MARVSILKSPDELTGEARRIAERIVDTRKSLEGPFSVWMHAPEWAERVAHLGTLVRWEGTLDMRLRTLAALVVGRHFQAQYVWGIQGVIGAERSIPRSTIDAIRDDRSDGISPDDLQIIDFTRQLLRKNRIDESLDAGGHGTAERRSIRAVDDLHRLLCDAGDDGERGRTTAEPET